MRYTLIFIIFSLFSIFSHASELELNGLDGKTYQLSDYKGKWAVVNYWATWCPPCLEEMPELQAFHDEHADTKAVVLGMNAELMPKKDILEFLDRYFISYPNFSAGPVSNTPLGTVNGLPTTFLVSPDGEVVAKQVGSVTREMIENFIQKWEAKEK